MNSKKNTVLIVAAHPDDELLGVGGTAAKHAKNGDEVFCLILGEGAAARAGGKEGIEILHEEAKRAAEVIGFKEIFFSNLPDNRFDSLELLDVVKEVEKHLEKIKPDVIYTHHGDDLNIDHRITFQAVLTACRPCNVNCPKEVYTFETLSSTEWQAGDKRFMPNTYIDIVDELEAKVSALTEYKSEVRKYPHPRSPEGIKILAQYRGLEAGLKYAEAFCLVRKIGQE